MLLKESVHIGHLFDGNSNRKMQKDIIIKTFLYNSSKQDHIFVFWVGSSVIGN